MSRKEPTRRLPIFNALRSNDQLKARTVLSSFGPISEPIHDAMLKLPRWLQEELLKELSIAALFLDDHLKAAPPEFQLPPDAPTEVPAVAIGVSEFGMKHFPAWLREFMLTQDISILRNLTPDEAKQQRTVVVGTIIEVTPAGKLRWMFKTNPSKTGFAFLSQEQLPYFDKKEHWILQHNGGDGIDSEIQAGKRLTAEEAEHLAHTLAATYRRYNKA